MNPEEKTAKVLQDPKVNIKIKLSLLWVALTFLHLYNDVITFFRGDVLEEVIAGEVGDIQITQPFLFAMAILVAIPIFMFFLSLALPAKANRWTNIIVGVFHAAILVGFMFAPAGETWAYYALYMAFEAVFIALIIWYAWKWPVQEGMPA